LADNEFAVLKEDFENLGIRLNIASKEEHVPEVERQIRVIKERARSIVQTLPYYKMPKKLKIAMIYYVVYCLNLLPKFDQESSPRDIIMGEEKLDYEKVCKIPFGDYVQVHDNLDTTNTMESRTTGAINLGPTGNIQGTHHFLSLKTGELVVRWKWTELPIPSDVIHQLEELAGESENVLESLIEAEEEEYEKHDELNSTEEREIDQQDQTNKNSQNSKVEVTEEVSASDESDKNDENRKSNDEAETIQNGFADTSEVSEDIDESEKENRAAITHSYGLRENRKRITLIILPFYQ